MRVFKKGAFYHYEFEFQRKRYQGSTRRKNEREAIQIATAKQFAVIKGSVGLGSREPAPTVAQFQKKFEKWLDQHLDDERTKDFYKTCYARLVECPHLANFRLDQIDEARIEKFKTWALSLDAVKSRTTVNRYLATLSKALHYAADKLKLIERVPKIHKYPKSKSCERERDFVFTAEQYSNWVIKAPEPLRSSSVIAYECGMSRNELLALQKDCVHLSDQPDARGLYGLVEVKRGLKRESRRRKLPVTAAMKAVFDLVIAQSKCSFVLTSPEDHNEPMSPNTLEDQIKRVRKDLGLPKDAGLHALRHTFLTHAGKLTQNVKALQLLAGHSNPVTTMRYIHPHESDVFGIVAGMRSPVKESVEGSPKETKRTRPSGTNSVPSKTPSVKSASANLAVTY